MAKGSKRKSRKNRRVPDVVEFHPGEPVHLRWLVTVDMPVVLRIDRLSHGIDSWIEEDFMNVLRSRNCIGTVADYHGHVLGYMLYELQKSRFDLMRICVLPEHCRKGIGTQMIEKLKSKMSPIRRNKIMVDVPADNVVLQQLLSQQEFRATEIVNEEGKEFYRMTYKHRDCL